ncbi:STAS domain-containing protein [Thiomicrorhabdus indica]|uniref:STAS domain-containing protein n=1 Tax=Thiomicrorhabdus indica TaxID=2267253 RepID=UPI00102DB522|nr:STAS domain-containing protein [Thiomicrorhabdus indica]
MSQDSLQDVLVIPAEATLLELSAWLKKEQVLVKNSNVLDFSQMRKGDSSILALMLYLQSQLPAGQKLLARHFPEQLKTLLELYDLENTFELE